MENLYLYPDADIQDSSLACARRRMPENDQTKFRKATKTAGVASINRTPLRSSSKNNLYLTPDSSSHVENLYTSFALPFARSRSLCSIFRLAANTISSLRFCSSACLSALLWLHVACGFDASSSSSSGTAPSDCEAADILAARLYRVMRSGWEDLGGGGAGRVGVEEGGGWTGWKEGGGCNMDRLSGKNPYPR